MKKGMMAAAAALLMLVGSVSDMNAQQKARPYVGGPGIAMAGSQNYSALPKEARNFIEKHFKGQKVTKCEQYFAKNKYEVELSNGIDIEFDNKGKVIEIDAPDNQCLSPQVVKSVLHGSAYKRLERDGMLGNVESVEFDKRGKLVEVDLSIQGPDTYVFDIDGNFIAISD